MNKNQKKEEEDFQVVTDLVAVNVLTQIAWQSAQENPQPTSAHHQSDDDSISVAEHHSDSENTTVSPIAFYFRLAKMLRRFFER